MGGDWLLGIGTCLLVCFDFSYNQTFFYLFFDYVFLADVMPVLRESLKSKKKSVLKKTTTMDSSLICSEILEAGGGSVSSSSLEGGFHTCLSRISGILHFLRDAGIWEATFQLKQIK